MLGLILYLNHDSRQSKCIGVRSERPETMVILYVKQISITTIN